MLTLTLLAVLATLTLATGIAYAEDGEAGGTQADSSEQRDRASDTRDDGDARNNQRDRNDSVTRGDTDTRDGDEDSDKDSDKDEQAKEDDQRDQADEGDAGTQDTAQDTDEDADQDTADSDNTTTRESDAADNDGARDIQATRATQVTEPQPLSVSTTTATTATTASDAQAATPAPVIRQARQLGRQVTGLALDVAVFAASAVHNVATGAAAIIGPTVLGGLPYSISTTVARAAADISRALAGVPRGTTSSGPFPVHYGLLNIGAYLNPRRSPPGANDPDITVSAEHPLPVILINGTLETHGFNWAVGAPVLANAGYKVYTFNYGSPHPNNLFQSTADIRISARQLGEEVDRVLAETGAPQVILVGHSQGGGILPAYYINRLDGADKVAHLVGIAPSNHGTDFNYLAGALRIPVLGDLLSGIARLFGPALAQQVESSRFQQEVYGDGDTRPGVRYTTIASTYDWVVTPYTTQALEGPDVTNIVLQDLYPGYNAGHLGIAFSPQLWDTVLAELATTTGVSTQLAAA